MDGQGKMEVSGNCTELFVYEGQDKVKISGNNYTDLFVYEHGGSQGKMEVSGNRYTELFVYEQVGCQGKTEVLGIYIYIYYTELWVVTVRWRFQVTATQTRDRAVRL